MICPRCSLAEISDSGQCALCGFSPSTNVILKQSVVEEVREIVEAAAGGRYHVESLLRLGERSLVYLAREPAYERQVALKVIPVSEGVGVELAQRFERQAGVYQRLQHAHVVPVLAFGTTHTFLWYSMEYIRGQTLADLLRESGPLSLERTVGIAEQVAGALDYAHRHGVAHGDLKPANILFDDRWVRVSDFAILDAFGRHPASGAAGPLVRMPEYMAPEQFYARTPGAGADQYSLAIIVYQCLTGTLPFIGDSFEEVARRQANDRPAPLSDVRRDIPVGVAETVGRALSKRPAERYSSVLEFVTALGAGATAPPAPAPAVAPVRRATPGPRAASHPVLVVDPEPTGRRRVWLSLFTVVALAGLGAAYLISQRSGPAPLGQINLEPSYVPAPEAARPGPQPASQPDQPRGPRPVVSRGDPASTGPTGARAAPRLETARSPVSPAPPPPQPGMLVVNASPWGQLYVDNRLVGNTPRGNLSVTAGQHLVRVQREGFETFERTVTVAPGETIRLTDIVLRPKSQ